MAGTEQCDPVGPSCDSSCQNILTCTLPQIAQADNSMCVLPPSNCQTLEPADYTLCKVCDGGYAVSGTQQCTDCRDGTVVNCLECDWNASFPPHEYECTECTSGYQTSSDG